MKKLRLRVFIVMCILAVILSANLLAACGSEDNTIDYSYTVSKSMFADVDASKVGFSVSMAIVIDSYKQYKNFINEGYVKNIDKHDDEFCNKIKECGNKKYFKSKAVIIVFIGRGNPGGSECQGLEINEDLIVVNIYNPPQEPGYDSPAVWTNYSYCIEVDSRLFKNKREVIINVT